jgi:hypothetical protein
MHLKSRFLPFLKEQFEKEIIHGYEQMPETDKKVIHSMDPVYKFLNNDDPILESGLGFV